MSHTVTFRPHSQEVDEFLPDVVEITCRRMRLPYLVDYAVGYDRQQGGKQRKATGWAVELPGWKTKVIFEEGTGNIVFDNWSQYHEQHPEVVAGRKRAGENGRWGDIKRLDEYVQNQFVSEYKATELMMEAKRRGDTFEYHGWNEREQQVEMALIHQQAG